MAISHVDDTSFDAEVLQADGPVLVDFWAEWCGPCKAIGPVLEALAETYQSKIKVVKVNVDNSQQSAAQYGIRSIPTLMIFKNGETVATHIGGAMQSQLAEFIEGNL